MSYDKPLIEYVSSLGYKLAEMQRACDILRQSSPLTPQQQNQLNTLVNQFREAIETVGEVKRKIGRIREKIDNEMLRGF